MRKEGLFDNIRSAFSPKKDAPAKTEPAFPWRLSPEAFPWRFSPEAEGYLKASMTPRYECSRRVLISNEPHSDKEGQLNLYKFLDVFFRDNPTLVRRSIFLAEGYPVNQQLSLQPLIEAEPNPSEELIREVLDSYLITGYMAYEWKHQKGIPIIGIENETLYYLAEDLLSKDPEGVDFVRKDHDGKTWTFTTRCVMGFVLRARNRSMASTLIEMSKIYKNPMLFVGASHLIDPDFDSDATAAKKWGWIFNSVKFYQASRLEQLENEGEYKEMGIWGRFFPREIIDFENLSITGYLEREKIGYVFISTTDIISTTNNKEEDTSTYERLFRAQQKGDYKEYVDWLISERGARRGVTTVRPSPEAAALLVNALKGLKDTKPFVGIGDPQSDAKFYKKQHGETCAIVAQEEIIHKLTGKDPGENTLKQKAIERGWYEEEQGTYDKNLGKLLELNGIPIEQRWGATIDDLKHEIEQGNEVIVGVDAGLIWYNKKYKDKGHAVWVTALRTDPKDGRIVSVAMNDSGNEKIDGGGEIPIDRFIRAWEKFESVMVVTRFHKR